ncbi:hypothetical protein CPAR01_03684 [Colletotrichum paranaense]|uniref:Secreted protein n=1 Tax=Colletotrichum paranaense TaxID=1914294 RepID=A0ABQ9SVP6_9PEZI|nr:uncharacterized protein CPAR01_03684 [Colletotrichum paranaense]KAK1543051.1 hypothetical protein CPAR01_03684 [Colletotrichum paranaense]
MVILGILLSMRRGGVVVGQTWPAASLPRRVAWHAVAQEERSRRLTGYPQFPQRCVSFCFSSAAAGICGDLQTVLGGVDRREWLWD